MCDRDMKPWCDVREVSVRSARELAMIAANDFLDPNEGGDMHAMTERLCALFKSRRGAVCGLAYDVEREALETEAVERLCAELAEWDIPTYL